MSPVGFEPAIPATKRPQTYALDRADIFKSVFLIRERRTKPIRNEPCKKANEFKTASNHK